MFVLSSSLFLWILHNHETEWRIFQVAVISHWDSYNGPWSHLPVHDSDNTLPMRLDLSCLWTCFPLNRTFLFQSAFSLPSTFWFLIQVKTLSLPWLAAGTNHEYCFCLLELIVATVFESGARDRHFSHIGTRTCM